MKVERLAIYMLINYMQENFASVGLIKKKKKLNKYCARQFKSLKI